MADPCKRCGHDNVDASNFCSSCGAPLTGITDAPTEMLALDDIAGATPEATKPLLGVAGFVVHRGPKAGSRYELESGLTTLGRHPESDIFFDDVTVSRRHVEVQRTEDAVTVTDVGSLNGTYVNRTMIEGATPLTDGDELQIGKFKLLYFTGDSA